MVRRIQIYSLAAAVVAGGAVLSAQTSAPASGGRSTTPAGGRAAAPAAGRAAAAKPVPLTPADAKALLGTWQLPLETPTGRLVANVVFRTEAGKVVVGLSAPQFPEHKVTDVTKAGQVITLRASTDYSGALAAYSGPVTMVMTLTPKGPDLAAWLDFNDSGFQIGGTARKRP